MYLINQKYSLTQTQPYSDAGTHTSEDRDPPLSATLRPQLCLSALRSDPCAVAVSTRTSLAITGNSASTCFTPPVPGCRKSPPLSGEAGAKPEPIPKSKHPGLDVTPPGNQRCTHGLCPRVRAKREREWSLGLPNTQPTGQMVSSLSQP